MKSLKEWGTDINVCKRHHNGTHFNMWPLIIHGNTGQLSIIIIYFYKFTDGNSGLGGIHCRNNEMGKLQIHVSSQIWRLGDPCFSRNMGNGKAAGHCIHSTTLPTHRLLDMPHNLNESPPSPGSVAGQTQFRQTQSHNHTYCTQSTASLALREHYHFCSACQLHAWKVAIHCTRSCVSCTSTLKTDRNCGQKKTSNWETTITNQEKKTHKKYFFFRTTLSFSTYL